METEQQPTDQGFSGKRWHFFVLLVGLWMMKSMGFTQVAVWVTAALGCFALLLVWLGSFFTPTARKRKVQSLIWYTGLLLLLAAKLIGLIWPVAEVAS